MTKGREKGRIAGRIEGIEEGKRKAIAKMLAKQKLTLEEIADLVGTTVEHVQGVAEELKK